MNTSNKKIRIAIQNNGRLSEASLDFLRKLGLKFRKNNRQLIVPCKNVNVEFLNVRNGDIPEYVSQNVADFGIVGENVLIERESNLKIERKLGFGECSLIIAVPKKSLIKSVNDLQEERIATSYPRTLKKFLSENKINASIIDIRGSVEIAPSLNLADAICDITQTGTTLGKNKLRIIAKIFDSQAVVVGNFCPNKQKWNDFVNYLKN
ncbi:MAG: ATP phosphoribosyltransferase [Candidatus Gracilibacteria bacterium]|jgi:ATP phosphoribosyltransferase